MTPEIRLWAAAWGIPPEALADLTRRLIPDPPPVHPGYSETAVQSRIRAEASEAGAVLWRNNVGAAGALRWGLANDSHAVNLRVKSSDLIGIRPLIITPEYVGATVGIFMAREVKRSGWKYTGTPRERAQLRFLEIVASMGGDASFTTREGSIK